MYLENLENGGQVRRHLSGGLDLFLLVVSRKPGAELHEGCECISSGGWQGHLRLQHLFQEC